MQKIFIALLSFLLLCLSGCVPVDSLNPLYSANNVIFDPGLVGRWATSDPDSSTFRFDRYDDDSYQMVVTGKSQSNLPGEAVFTAHLVSLGGEKYLDVEPRQFDRPSQMYLLHTDPEKKGSKFEPSLQQIASGIYMEVSGPNPGKGTSQEMQVKIHPAHWIFKVYLREKSLTLDFLDREWVEEQIGKKLLQARHLNAKNENGSNWVLSGSTAELQQFVVHHADDPGAFDSGWSMAKIDKTE
jgi:hypothetical protein